MDRSLALLLLLLTACAGLRHRPVWVERVLPIPTDEVGLSEDVLWQYAQAALEANDFPIGRRTDPSERRIVSGWRTDMQPFRGEGFRERATLELERTDEGFVVNARVEREINQDIAKPLLATYAKWERAPDNEGAALRLVQFIESRIDAPFELGGTEEKKVDDVEDPFERIR